MNKYFNKFGILSSESEAKVFSKKLDLKKYLDIRSIKMEVE